MVPESPRDKPAPRKPPLPPQQVAEAIQMALGPSGTIFPTHHFLQRGRERNFTMQDAVVSLEGGTVAAAPHWNEKTGTWNYDVQGADLDGEALTVRIAVEDPRSIVLVTAF